MTGLTEHMRGAARAIKRWRGITFILGVAVAVMVLGTLGIKADSACARAPFGFNDEPAAFTAGPASQLAREAGARVARMPVDVGVLQTVGWAPYDAAIQGAGVPVIASIADDVRQSPAEVAKWAAEAAHRYRWELKAIQVWNEPNLFGKMPAKKYAKMLRKARASVRGVPLIAAAPSPGVRGWERYERVFWKRAPSGVGASIHAYSSGPDPVGAAVKQVRAAREFSRQVWVTEAGIVRSVYGADQARLTRKMYRALSKLRGVKAVVFHRLLEPIYPSGWELNAHSWAVSASGEPTEVLHALEGA